MSHRNTLLAGVATESRHECDRKKNCPAPNYALYLHPEMQLQTSNSLLSTLAGHFIFHNVYQKPFYAER